MRRRSSVKVDPTEPNRSTGNPSSKRFTEKFGLQPRYAYSAKELAPHSFQFLDETTIAFPVGTHLWRMFSDKQQMAFLSRRASSSPPYLRTSKDRKRLVVAETIENGARQPQFAFFDISGPTPTILWRFAHHAKGVVTGCDISSDGKVVVAHIKYLDDESNPNRKAGGVVCLWKAETKKLIATKEVTADIMHLTINPEDGYLVCASGYKYLRYLKCVGNSLDEVPLLKRHNERSYTFVDHVWVTPEVLACLTETSAVCVFVKGDLKQKIPRKEGKDTSGGNITCIEANKNGFILGTSDGYILFYTQDKNKNYKFVKEFDTGHNKEIVDLATNPHKELLAVGIKDYGLVTFPCGKVGWGNDDEVAFTDCIMPCGTTVAMDISEQRQLVVTASLDNVVRVFDNIRDSKEVVKCKLSQSFDEVPLAVAVHPGGLSMVLAFSKHLAMYHILRNSFEESFVWQLQVPMGPHVQVKYSNGGHKLAVSTGEHLFIYHAQDYALLQYIAVQRPIRTFTWSTNDLYMAVCTLDGAIYSWELETLKRIQSCTDKGLKYEDVAMDWGINWRYTENLCKPAGTPKRLHTLADHQDDASLSQFLQQQEDLSKVSALTSSELKAAGGGDHSHTTSSSSSTGKRKSLSVNNSNKNYTQANPRRHGGQNIVAAGGGSHHKMQYVSDGVATDIKLGEQDGKSAENSALSDFDFGKIVVTQLVLDTSRNVLIAGTKTGYILLFKYPFANELHRSASLTDCYARYPIHDGPVLHLKLMQGHGVLLSNGADGNLFLMDMGVMGANGTFTIKHQRKIKQRGERDLLTQHMSGSLRNALYDSASGLSASTGEPLNQYWEEEIYGGNLDIVQVRHSEYDEVIRRAKQHELELKQLQTQAAYQLKTAKDHHTEEMRLLRGDMETILEKKKGEVDVQKNKNHQLVLLQEKIQREGKEKLERVKFEINEAFDFKLHQQYQLNTQKDSKIKNLDTHLGIERRKLEQQLRDLKRSHEAATATLISAHEDQVKTLQQEKAQQEAEYEEVIRQMEEEHSVEVAWLEKNADDKLRTTRETTAIARAKMTTMLTKFEGNQNTLSTLRILNNEQDDLLQKREEQIMYLKGDIKSGKTESKMKEVELTRRQHELANARKSSTVLQNFIGVLEHRINELEEREQPTQRFLATLKEQIEKMNEEFFEQTQVQQKLKHLAQKRSGDAHRLSSTVARLQHEVNHREKRWTHVVKELKHIVHHTPTAEWEGALKSFYNDYISAYSHTVDEDDRGIQNKVYNVLDRQRRHLEHSLNQMKRSVKAVDRRRNVETEKAVQRNTLFLAEVNELREQNKKLEQRCKKYMSMALVANKDANKGGVNQLGLGLASDIGNDEAALNNPNVVNGRKRRSSLSGDIKPWQMKQLQLPNTAQAKGSSKRIGHKRATTSSAGKSKSRGASRDGGQTPVWEYRPRNSKPSSSHRVIRGSTKPLSAVTELKRKLHFAQTDLENVHQQMALQKLEISHLQEGVNVALDLAHTNFNQYSGQQLSAVRGISDALVQDEADYNNVSAAPDSPPAVSAVDRLAARLGGPRPGSSHSSKRLPALDPDYRSNSSKLHKSHSAAANLGKKKKYRI